VDEEHLFHARGAGRRVGCCNRQNGSRSRGALRKITRLFFQKVLWFDASVAMTRATIAISLSASVRIEGEAKGSRPPSGGKGAGPQPQTMVKLSAKLVLAGSQPTTVSLNPLAKFRSRFASPLRSRAAS
jgi:hypothetical protein